MSEQDLETTELTGSEEQTEENQTEEKQPDVEQLIAQKTHWREKAKKLEAELKAAKPQVKPSEPVQDSTADVEWKRRIEFTVTHKEYDADDINKLLVISKGLGVDLEKAQEDQLFKSYYENKQKENEAKKSEPTIQGRGPKVVPPKPVQEMSAEEHRAYWEKVRNG